MNINLLIVCIGILANVILGLFVFLRNRRSVTTILFFLLTIDIGAWSLVNYLTLQFTDLLLVLYLTRIVMALAVPQAALFFLLIHTLPKTRFQLPIRRLLLIVTAGLVVMGLCVSPYLFPSIIFTNGTPSPTPGPAMPIFVVYAVGLLLSGAVLLMQKIRHSKGIEKKQFQIIGIGIMIMFLLIVCFNFILVVVFSVSSFVSISPLYTLPFVGATAYAIAKHKFLDVRAVVARSVSYTVLVTLFAILYALVFSLASSLLVTPFVDTRLIVLSAAAALCMLLTFPIARRAIEKETDAIFYKDRYDSNLVLYALTEIMASTLRLEDLGHRLLESLLQQMRIEKGAIILFRNGEVSDVMSSGYKTFPAIDEDALWHLAQTRDTVNRETRDADEMTAVLQTLDASIAVHLRTEGVQIGLLLVGAKLSGENFTEQDSALLEILAPEAAVAIQNAFAYEEIRRFNKTLQDEISKATTDLRAANERLEELDKLKDEFVSLASHELRTPLAAIRSYIWMAISGKDAGTAEKHKFYLDRAFVSTNRLIKLVNDMLNISRIESGRISMSFQECSLTTLVQEVVDEVQPKVDERKLHLKNAIAIDTPHVIADVDKIKEVFVNFIGNSIKFTPADGTITVSATTDAHMVTVSVIDTGIGIEKDQIGKLFTKFSTIHNGPTTTEQTFQSTGLGLYISKSIIELHGGTVEVHSEGAHKGTEFRFTLPLYSSHVLASMQKKYPSPGLGIIPTQIS